MRESRSQQLAVVAAILVMAASHWVVPRADKQLHNLLYNLDFVPILVSAMLFGWRGAVLASVLTLAAEFPSLRYVWPVDPAYRVDQMGETLASGMAGVVVGLLADHGRRQRAELAEMTDRLEHVNQELHANLDRLAKAERMYAVAQLSSSLAHEIRNPLESISGAAGILRRGHARPDDLRECLDIIEIESQRLNALLTQFLTFASPRALRVQPTDLLSLVDSTVALARHAGDAADIEFHTEVSEPLPEVACDSEQVKQVLLNVLMNAAQATRRGRVTLHVSVAGDEARVRVEDEGPGLSSDAADRMFEPFYTTKANGTGLGLAIARKIIDQHGGRITAQNRARGGLAVAIHLPVLQEPA